MRRYPKPITKPQAAISVLGPNLSLRPPKTIAPKPIRISHSEAAPEIVALDHPNSISNGMKKTPKALYIPHVIAWITTAAITTI